MKVLSHANFCYGPEDLGVADEVNVFEGFVREASDEVIVGVLRDLGHGKSGLKSASLPRNATLR